MVMRSDCGRNGRWERVVPERIGMGHSISIWCIRTSGITARQQSSAGDTRSPRHFRRRLRRTHDDRNSTSFKGLKHARCEDAVGTAARCRHNHRLLDQCSVLPWLIDETTQPHAPASGTDSAADPLHVDNPRHVLAGCCPEGRFQVGTPHIAGYAPHAWFVRTGRRE